MSHMRKRLLHVLVDADISHHRFDVFEVIIKIVADLRDERLRAAFFFLLKRIEETAEG